MTEKKLRTGLIMLIGALATLQPFVLDPYLSQVGAIVKDFSVSASIAQLTLSALTLGIAAGTLIAGPVSDAVGRKKPALIALAAYVLAGIFVASTQSIEGFFAGRVLQGFFGASLAVLANAMLRDLYDGLQLIKAMGRMLLVQASSWVLAPFLGSASLYFTNWRGLSLIVATIGLTLLLVCLRILPDTMHTDDRRASSIGALATRFKKVFRDRVFVGVVAVQVMIMLALFSYLNLSPFIFGDVYGIPANLVGFYFAVCSAAAYLGSQLGAKLANRFQPQWVLLASMLTGLTAGILLIVGGYAGGSILMYEGLLMLFTFSFGATITPVFSLAMSAHPNEAGTAAGVLGVVGFIATTALGGVYLLLDHKSSAGVGLGMTVSLSVALVIFFAVIRPKSLAKLS